jgi:3-hydroxyacyl-CoA dehydrogenase/3-hydroxy-2-methylbutyryl-CoA dehydrogenase
MEIKNTVSIITGGASGIGEACARKIIEAGGRVAILDLNGERGESLIGQLGDAARFFKADVTSERDVEAAIGEVMKSFGGIHVTINCAGIGIPAKVLSKRGPIPMDTFRKVVEVNLFGTMNVLRLTTHEMLKNTPNEDGEKGVVINTASIAAFEGQIGQASYSASKAALVGMTLPIAREFAEYGLRINTIAPGLIDTPLFDALSPEVKESLKKSVPFPRRMGKPSEFAGLACHIIENPMINGETIRLDGALRMAAR